MSGRVVCNDSFVNGDDNRDVSVAKLHASLKVSGSVLS